MKDLHEICGRFEMENSLIFEKDAKIIDIFHNLQAFLEEIFHQKHFYLE